MKDLISRYEFYKRRFNADPDFHSELTGFKAEKLCVVIPAHNELLEECLQSLGRCNVDSEQISVLIVFNNEVHSDLTTQHQNQFEQWNKVELPNGIKVQAIAALNLPSKHAGVGLARKIGMDAALALFAATGYDGLIVCLDADCSVSENYLEELLRAEAMGVNGLSIYFEHPLDGLTPDDQERITRYEVWLRYYVHALRSISYPFAFHTVGSSMAARASVYAKIGGMNRRKAGEDFYFLHKLIPQGEFYDLTSAKVYPSARDSNRVPFGTGRAMLDMRLGNKDFSKVYSPQIFKEIEPLLSIGIRREEGVYQHFSKPLQQAIEELNWADPMKELIKRSPNDQSLSRNFIHWLDGFKMLKLVHWLRDNHYGEVDQEVVVSNILNIKSIDTFSLMLALRNTDRESTESFGTISK